MATRTHTARKPGPVTLNTRLVAGHIRVTVCDIDHAEIIIRTADDSGPCAEAVNTATINDNADHIDVFVYEPPSTGGIVVNHRGGVSIQSGHINGTVTISSGNVTINGMQVSGQSNITAGGSPITIEARLPLGSSLEASTTSAYIVATGPLCRAQAATVSGDIRIDAADILDLSSTSGDITVRAHTGHGTVRTVSGDIIVRAAAESQLQARSVSGDIRVQGAQVDLDATTVSGRVTQR